MNTIDLFRDKNIFYLMNEKTYLKTREKYCGCKKVKKKMKIYKKKKIKTIGYYIVVVEYLS